MTEESIEPQKPARRPYTRRSKTAEPTAANAAGFELGTDDETPATEANGQGAAASAANGSTAPTVGAADVAAPRRRGRPPGSKNRTTRESAVAEPTAAYPPAREGAMDRPPAYAERPLAGPPAQGRPASGLPAQERPPLPTLQPGPRGPAPIEAFRDLGRDMFLTGLVSSHTGSLSVRQEGRMYVSRRGAMLGRLTEADLVEVQIAGEVPEDAAEEAIVHQAVYRVTDARSVIYARPPWTMALALVEDRLSPASRDGADNLGSAPVLISQRAIDSPDIAQLIGRTLRESRVAALRGQGVFARGSDLFDAFHMVSLLEEMCKVVQIYRTLAREEAQPIGYEQRQPQQFRPRNDNYGRRPAQGRPPRGPGGPPRQGDGGPPRRPPFQPRDPNGARRGPPPRH